MIEKHENAEWVAKYCATSGREGKIMSRIGKTPIEIKAGVEISISETVIEIKGPKGSVVRLLVMKRESEFDDYPDTLSLERDVVDVVDEDATFDVVPFNSQNKIYNFGIIKIPSFYINFDDAQKGRIAFTILGYCAAH